MDASTACVWGWSRQGRAGINACGVGMPVEAAGMCWRAGDVLLQDAVQMSLSVGLVQPNDHIVVVQMISEAFVVKARRPPAAPFIELGSCTPQYRACCATCLQAPCMHAAVLGRHSFNSLGAFG